VFFRVEGTSQLVCAEVYIESYSDKISLKTISNTKFNEDLINISTQESAITKIISLLKEQTVYTDFTAK